MDEDDSDNPNTRSELKDSLSQNQFRNLSSWHAYVALIPLCLHHCLFSMPFIIPPSLFLDLYCVLNLID